MLPNSLYQKNVNVVVNKIEKQTKGKGKGKERNGNKK